MNSIIKKGLFYLTSVVGSSFALTVSAVAPGAPPDETIDLAGLFDKLIEIRNYVFGGGLIIAVIIFVAGGIQYMTAGGDEEKTTSARKKFIYGIVGAAIIVCAWVLVTLLANFLGVSPPSQPE